MICYRIYTERKNLKWVYQIVAEHFLGFTIYKTIGYWQGKPEKSVVIEIFDGGCGAEFYIRRICMKIKGYNKQQEVMYTKSEIKMEVL